MNKNPQNRNLQKENQQLLLPKPAEALNKKELIERLIKEQAIRREVCRKSHELFFPVYFSDYIKYPSADFHRNIFKITEDQFLKISAILTFRGSGKSTIVTLSYPIWSIIGVQKKKFVLIVSRTEQLAKLHMSNLKRELESNELLRQDLGPFEEQNEEWNSGSLVIPKYGARITVVSIDQSIRGIRHASYRPDLIICDDVEDLASVKTMEGRQKTFQWFTGDVIPAGDKNTKIVVVGNLLHEQSLLMRLKEKITSNEISANFLEVPIINKKGEIAWPGKFKNMEEIEAEKRNNVDDGAWNREYMLRIISEYDRVIHPEWIQYYDMIPPVGHITRKITDTFSPAELKQYEAQSEEAKARLYLAYILNRPKNPNRFRFAIIGVDLAISEKNSADYTAIVSAYVFGFEDDLKIYILPDPINKRMGFPETIQKIMDTAVYIGKGVETQIKIEDVGYQRSAVHTLQSKKFKAEGVAIHGDKRSRLSAISHLIQNGTVLFPRKGAEQLIAQIVNFGKENHDDLTDALSVLVNSVAWMDNRNRTIHVA